MDVIRRDSTHTGPMLSPHDVMAAENVPVMLARTPRDGSVVVRYSRLERWDVMDGRAPVWRRAAHLKLAAAVLGGIGIGAMLALAFSGPSRPMVSARDATVDLSPAVVDIPPVAMPVRAAPAPVVRVPGPRAVIAGAAVAAPATVTPTTATAVERPGPDSESAALAQAFSRNEAVSWRNATGTGTVVVGVAAIEDGKYCRDVAVLTRTDGVADRTVNGRKCLEPGGRITDQAAAVPQ